MKNLLFALIALLVIGTSESYAAPSYRSALTAARVLSNSEKKLARVIRRLSVEDRARLKAALARVGGDSDTDGSSDLYEKAIGTKLCDSDTDDDGVEDGDDDFEKDDDKVGEIEVKGKIVSFVDPSLVVGSKTFIVNESTTFRRTSKSELAANLCVEVKGYSLPDSSLVASRIEKDDDCD